MQSVAVFSIHPSVECRRLSVLTSGYLVWPVRQNHQTGYVGTEKYSWQQWLESQGCWNMLQMREAMWGEGEREPTWVCRWPAQPLPPCCEQPCGGSWASSGGFSGIFSKTLRRINVAASTARFMLGRNKTVEKRCKWQGFPVLLLSHPSAGAWCGSAMDNA